MGGEEEVTQYLPESVPLTRERRERADRLDTKLKQMAGVINEEYENLPAEIKKNEFNKWKWLGDKIDRVLQKLENLDRTDVDNYAIWPAIGQYLRKELKRGFEDKKRSGTKKDHYRKCWALATMPGTGWITSWVGWDAFTDRGEQLVYSKKLMPLMEKKFLPLREKLNPKDFQYIAKLVTEKIPTQAKNPTDIDAMSETELKQIVDSVYQKFLKNKQKEKSKN